MGPLRLFVALAIGQEVKDSLAAAQQRLARTGAHVKWVRPGSIHLTLKFIGNADPDQVEPIGLALAEAAAGVKPFEIEVRGVGLFPDRRKPRVAWAGLTGDIGIVSRLVERLDEHLFGLGFPAEKRPFRAHLTLGRIRSDRNLGGLLAALDKLQDHSFGTIAADRLILFRSQLLPDGAIYTRLVESPLVG